MQIPIADTPTNKGGYLPEQTYRVRVVDTNFVSSNSSGNPMTSLSCEIIEPDVVEFEGNPLPVAGRTFTMFLVHITSKGGWGTQDAVLEFCRKLNIDLGSAYDTDLHETYFKGMEFDIILRSKEDVKRYQTGPNKGKALLDGEGKEIKGEQRINAGTQDVLEYCHPTRNAEVAGRPY